jgi:mRNA interferase MazF
LSRNVFNDKSGTVIAVALTSQPQKAGFPLTLELLKTKNLPKRSWVKVSQIRTLSVERVSDRITTANEEEISQIIEGLNEIIGA